MDTNEEVVITKGDCWTPPRFWEGSVVTGAIAHQLLTEGYIIYAATPTELAALKALGGSGCWGDWKDTYHTMYGKEIRRII